MEKRELELYVHIPFCVKKCAYCDFLSFPSGEAERASYVDALVWEIEGQKDRFRDYSVSTVFLGGGTPSLLREDDTARIFHALKANFDISGDAEITMEVNPGTVTAKKAAAWKACSVNRLSIGLQSVNDDELKMLGRIHTFREFLNSWDIIRNEGFDNVNIDLISAIPGQTPASWEKTLRAAAALAPEHLSAYSLIIEEGTPFYKLYGEEDQICGNAAGDGRRRSVLPLPDEDTEREIYKATADILEEYGYHRYEISNYAKDGCECRHNLGYWERKEYLGLGLGASSLIRNQRFHNTTDMDKYMEAYGIHGGGCGSAVDEADRESLSVRDQMEEFLFLGLRKMRGISQREFYETFGRGLSEVFGDQIRKLADNGLLAEGEGRLCLTEKGIDLSNYVFAELLTE